jgi:FKBP-type peptidyl-prolyl cis-trans isomerase FkpA
MKYFLLLILGLVLFSCTPPFTEAEITQQIDDYIIENDLELLLSPSGIRFQIVEDGKGYPLRYNDQIEVTYKGTFLDGKVFDERKDKITFTLKNLIPAWKEVLVGQNVGTKIFMIVPPKMGYGDQENPGIPANSVLVFELTIHDAF